MGDWATILQAVFTAVLGVVCLASSMQGWLLDVYKRQVLGCRAHHRHP